MDPVLTVCIASYNKSDLTYNLVKSILKNPNPKLAVSVVDNASTDNTVDKLHEIEDDRFRLKVNDDNIGGPANFVGAIYSCGGGIPFIATTGI